MYTTLYSLAVVEDLAPAAGNEARITSLGADRGTAPLRTTGTHVHLSDTRSQQKKINAAAQFAETLVESVADLL